MNVLLRPTIRSLWLCWQSIERSLPDVVAACHVKARLAERSDGETSATAAVQGAQSRHLRWGERGGPLR